MRWPRWVRLVRCGHEVFNRLKGKFRSGQFPGQDNSPVGTDETNETSATDIKSLPPPTEDSAQMVTPFLTIALTSFRKSLSLFVGGGTVWGARRWPGQAGLAHDRALSSDLSIQSVHRIRRPRTMTGHDPNDRTRSQSSGTIPIIGHEYRARLPRT